MRAKAYTLVEVLVVMALSVMVIGIAYLLLANVSSMQAELQLQARQSTEITTLDMHLRADAQRAEHVAATPSRIIFQSANHDTTAQYTMHAEGMSRVASGAEQHFFLPIHRLQIREKDRSTTICLYHGADPAAPDSIAVTMLHAAKAREIPKPEER